MKFSLIFLVGLCAFASASPKFVVDIPQLEYIEYAPIQPEISTDGLMDEMDGFIQNAIEQYNKVIEKFNNFAAEIKEQLESMLESASQQIQDSIDSVQGKINEIKKKGAAAKLCVSTYENEMVNLKEFALRGIKECISTVVQALKDFVKIVTAETIDLLKNINNLKDLVMNCYNQDGTIATTKCAFKSIKEATKLITNIINGAKSLVDSIVVQSNNIMDSIRLCKENYILGSLERIEEIRNEIETCYDNESYFKNY